METPSRGFRFPPLVVELIDTLSIQMGRSKTDTASRAIKELADRALPREQVIAIYRKYNEYYVDPAVLRRGE